MAFQDLKFSGSDFVNQDISSLPDKVTGQAAFLKDGVFDFGNYDVLSVCYDEIIADHHGIARWIQIISSIRDFNFFQAPLS